MRLDVDLPELTSEIFDTLSEGKFLCKNHPNRRDERLYESCLEYYDALKKYFSIINIDLINEDDEYFYFGDLKIVEAYGSEIDMKLKEFVNYIRFYSILLESYDYFGVGVSFTRADVEQKVIANIALRSRYKKDDKTIRQEIEREIKMFVKSGYLYKIDEKSDKYVALASIARLKDFIGSIKIEDEIFEELEDMVHGGDENE
jgi:hypothetical protein